MDDLQEQLRATFLEEAVEVLESLEQAFLAWEDDRQNTDVIDKIFRLAHNLKGSSKAVGFMEIGAFTHDLESLMLKIKNHEIPVDDGIFDLLLKCNDELAHIVNAQKDGSALAASPDLVAQVQLAIEGRLAAPDAGADEVAVAANESSNFGFFDQTSSLAPAHAAPPTLTLAPIEPLASPEPTTQPRTPAPVEKKAAVDDSMRVSLQRVDSLVTMIGELVILQTVLSQQRHQITSPLLQRTVMQLGKITKEIQDTSMGLRMVPLKSTFQKMQRIVRDTSKALGKDIELVLSGEDTELDKSVVDQLGDPLVHLIRNACDHAIELPDERTAAGKSPTGKIRLSAGHQGGKMVIEIKDDGRGLDAEKLRKKALEKGIIRPEQKLSETQCHHLIFAPGFSTKEAVTDLSGRGVGMDVVKTNVEKSLKGEVILTTERGIGTTIRIVLPLTLAIIDSMIVRAAGDRYVLSLAQVHESVRCHEKDLHRVVGLGEVLVLRGESLPVYRLARVLSAPSASAKSGATTNTANETAIIVRTSGQQFAMIVDEIVARQQVVIKRLGTEVRAGRGIVGGAVLGDGSAALILDLAELTNVKERAKGVAA